MSLINQMLKDLDKRSPGGVEVDPKDAACGVRPVDSERCSRRPLWLAIGCVVLMAAAGIWWGFLAAGGDVAEQSSTALAEPAVPPARPPAVPQAVSVVAAETSSVPDERGPVLESVGLRAEAGGVLVEAVLSADADYRLVWREQRRQLVLELSDIAMKAKMPVVNDLPLLRGVTSEQDAEGARLVFSLRQTGRYEGLSVSEQAGGFGKRLGFILLAERQATQDVALPDLRPAKEATVAAQATPERAEPAAARPPQASVAAVSAEAGAHRSAVPAAPRQQADRLCRDGLAAWRQGRLHGAEAALRKALALEPGHIVARDVLLRLLSAQRREAALRAVLAEGTRAAPEHLAYRLRYARLLIEAGALENAQQELLREPRPALADAPDLYAMLAALYQRRGLFAEAADTYRRLLSANPRSAVWWMGFGIALEGTSSVEQARQAYRQALARGGLSTGLQDYVRQRLAQLDQAAGRPTAVATEAGREAS